MTDPVVVRFAPSPSGYLHIGGARTAIFNWLFARKTGGTFILRIEDTDAERTTEASVAGIVDGLRWLGLDWDVGPNFQSRYVEDHRAAVRRLVDGGHAYKCFCTPETLEAKRAHARRNKLPQAYDGTCRALSPEDVEKREAAGEPWAVRLKVPRHTDRVVFDDLVYGRVEKKTADLEDFVIQRSNGQPLYVLANAVDDIRDGVTHVIRGQDGLANTPKQILVYQALGAPLPVFAHMSLALDPRKRKISKRRHGERVAVDFYRRNGFLPWAMVNFLVLYGWSRPDDREIYDETALVDAFSLEGITRHNPVIDLRSDDPKFVTDPKAYTINAHYIKTLPLADIADRVREELLAAGTWDPAFDGDRRAAFLERVDLIRSRCHRLTDFATLGRAYFGDDYPVDEKALKKAAGKHGGVFALLPRMADVLSALPAYDNAAIEAALKQFLAEHKVNAGTLVNVVRLAVTGQPVGPEFLDVLRVLGRETVAERLRRPVALPGR